MGNLTAHIEKEGMFGGPIMHWEINGNEYGFQITVVFANPQGFAKYNDVATAWIGNDTRGDSVTAVWTQVVAFEKD